MRPPRNNGAEAPCARKASVRARGDGGTAPAPRAFGCITRLARALLIHWNMDDKGATGSWRFWIVAAIIAAAVTVSCAGQQAHQPAQQKQLAQAVAAPSQLRPPEHLSDAAQSILKSRMAFHARDMSALVTDIMLLRYPEIQDGAQRIAADANLSRPLSNDASELNSALPAKFFAYQDNLRLEARTLAEAAGREHAFDVADAYGRLSQVCVRCHATYRSGR